MDLFLFKLNWFYIIIIVHNIRLIYLFVCLFIYLCWSNKSIIVDQINTTLVSFRDSFSKMFKKIFQIFGYLIGVYFHCAHEFKNK